MVLGAGSIAAARTRISYNGKELFHSHVTRMLQRNTA